ncbi:hypothetical protein B484DRAFT_314331, partial [Ochromonadaceae sp. CCMP2298]
ANLGSEAQQLFIIDIAPEKVGQVIGSKGLIIADIQARSGARAYVNQDFPDGAMRQVNITGTMAQVQAARALIQMIVSQGPTAIQGPQVSAVVECSQPQVGKIIGTGGSTIRELQMKSGARIQIEQ